MRKRRDNGRGALFKEGLSLGYLPSLACTCVVTWRGPGAIGCSSVSNLILSDTEPRLVATDLQGKHLLPLATNSHTDSRMISLRPPAIQLVRQPSVSSQAPKNINFPAGRRGRL